jgi:hypothetical protein
VFSRQRRASCPFMAIAECYLTEGFTEGMKSRVKKWPYLWYIYLSAYCTTPLGMTLELHASKIR